MTSNCSEPIGHHAALNCRGEMLDRSDWYRVGRGRTIACCATDADLNEWLEPLASNESIRFEVVKLELKRTGKVYVPSFEVLPLEKLLSTPWGESDVFLFSRSLTPDFDPSLCEDLSASCSLNGFISIQHGKMLDLGWTPLARDASHIGIVDLVRNMRTGETHKHEEYNRVFSSLKRRVRKALVYSTIVSFPSGEEFEDRTLELMTARAAEAHALGDRYLRRPGRTLAST